MRTGWTDWLILGMLFVTFTVCLALGSSWDAHWHWWVGRDSTWIPPHMLLYTGIGLSFLLALLMMYLNISGRGTLFGIRTPGRDPPPHSIVAAGAGTMFAAAGIDTIWHAVIGDRMLWNPPHVLFVLGGAAVGLGTACAWTQAASHRLMPPALAQLAVAAFAGGVLVAVYFSILPVAMLLFDQYSSVTRLLFKPSPNTLAGAASLLMPGTLTITHQALGRRGFAAIGVTALVMWWTQELLHLVFTPLLAPKFGYTIHSHALPLWHFEFVVFMATLIPALAAGRVILLRPWVGGAACGVLYLGEVLVAGKLANLPVQLSAAGFAACVALGVAGATSGVGIGRWMKGLIHATAP